MNQPSPRFRPTDNWVRALFPAALIFVAACMDRNYQTDLWHHLARGKTIAEEGRILNEDRFTFTVHGQELVDVNWGWQVAFYRLYQWGGLTLVQVVNALILACTIGLLTYLCHRHSGSWQCASLAGVFTVMGIWQLLLIRPQTLSFLLFVAMFLVLEEGRRRRWMLAFPPFIMVLWVNVHGGFPIGLVLFGSFFLAELIEVGCRKWSVTLPEGQSSARVMPVLVSGLLLGVSVLATLVNPYGLGVYEYVARTSNRAYSRRIDEWMPAGFEGLIGKMWVASLICLVVLMVWSPRRFRVREFCWLFCFLPFACKSVRMLAWWFIILAPILAAHLASILPSRRSEEIPAERRYSPALVFGLLVVVMGLSLPWFERINPFLRDPARTHRLESDLGLAEAHLRSEERRGRVFTRFAWAEHLGWELSPHFHMFMDGRIEIIPDNIWDEYTAVTRGRADWEEILQSHAIDLLVLDAGAYHSQLLPFVQRSNHWELAFSSGPVQVFRRVPTY